MGKQWKQWQTLFFWAPKSLQMVTAAMKLKDTWKGQSADGMSADLLELSQSKSPHMSVGAGGRTVSYYNQDFRAGLSSHMIFHA